MTEDLLSAVRAARLQLIDHGDEKTAALLAQVISSAAPSAAEPVGRVVRSLDEDGHCRWGFHPQDAAWKIEGGALAKRYGADAAFDVYAAPAASEPVAIPSPAVAHQATPALKRHALDAADRLSMYAAAPFFPDVQKRGVKRATTSEWWDGLAELLEEAQPLIKRALAECNAPISDVPAQSTQCAATADAPVAEPVALKEDMVRFCPGCGSVGEVEKKFRDCCPDGSRARLIPEPLARQCRDLFQLALRAATSPVAEEAKGAARDVLAERQRQISAEGWTPEHDDEHDVGELSQAAAFYAMYGLSFERGRVVWPWDESWLKPGSRRRNLVKAGALILAEIERLDRAAVSQGGGT